MWIFGYGSLVWKVDFPYVKKVMGYIKGYERKFWQASIDHRGVPEKPGRVVTLIQSDDPEACVFGVAYEIDDNDTKTISELNAKVWGAAYKIHSNDINRVLHHLDLREVMGYEKVDFYPIPNHPQNILEPASPLDYNNMDKNRTKFPNGPTPVESSTSAASDSGTEEMEGSSSSFEEQDIEEILLCESSDNELPLDILSGNHFPVTMYYGSAQNEHYIGPDSLSAMAAQIHSSSGPSGANKDYLFNLASAMRSICKEALDTHLSDLEKAVRKLDHATNSNTIEL